MAGFIYSFLIEDKKWWIYLDDGLHKRGKITDPFSMWEHFKNRVNDLGDDFPD